MSSKGGGRVQTGLRLSQESYDILAQSARENGRSIGEEMDRMIQFYAEHHKGQPLPEDLDARLRAVEEYVRKQANGSR